MTRSSLFSLLMVGCLAFAGAARAQDPAPAGDPDPMLQSATGEPGQPAQPGQPASPQYDPNRPSADPNRPATDPTSPSTANPDRTATPRTGDVNDPTRRNLPATASNAPVLLLIGAVALGTLAAFLVLRRRGVTHTS